jgi:Ni,Fe-hydrogenase III component G
MNADPKDRLSEINGKLTAVKQTTDNRIYLLCEAENCHIVNRFLFEQLTLRFVIATAIDCSSHFEILYHFSNDATGHVVTTKAFIRDYQHPSIESTAQFLPAASWIEREIHDEFGIEFRNHPNMKRLILADDWPDGVYPLRKKSQK